MSVPALVKNLPLLCIIALAVNAEQQSVENVRALQIGSSQVLHIPDFNYYAHPACDQSGNLFFLLKLDGSVLRIAENRTETKTFVPQPPQEEILSGNVQFVAFAVSPSGTLYELLQSKNAAYRIEFDADGSIKSTRKLDVPEHMEAQRIAVFDDGVMMLSGFFTKLAPEAQRGKGFAALFEPSGKLRKRLTDAPNVSLDALGKKLQSGAVAIGDDGRAYVATSDRLSTISETGEVIRRLRLPKVDSSTSFARVEVSEGLIVVTLEKMGADHQIQVKYLVINASTGAKVGLFQSSDALGSGALCFTGAEGFLFQQVDDNGQIKLVKATLP
jgi:hypothetical protein